MENDGERITVREGWRIDFQTFLLLIPAGCVTPGKLLTFLCLSCLVYYGINNAYQLTRLLQRLNDKELIKTLSKCDLLRTWSFGRVVQGTKSGKRGRNVAG